MSGKLTLSFGSESYDMGIVQSISEKYAKSVATTPIPTMSENATYVIESGSSINMSIELTRKTPDDGKTSGGDASLWTNAYWYEKIQRLVNRWQARTNGCTLRYEPGADNPYIPARVYNGYIKSMTRTFKPGDPTMIYTSLEFHVGTMTVNKQVSGTPTPASAYEITMSNGDQSKWFALMKGNINCISSYTVEGGAEQPFESITMEIPKNRLTSVANELVNNIVPGGSKVILSAVGNTTMTVVKCKLTSDKTYKITAYCEAERIKGYTLTGDGAFDPWYWITYILTSGEFGISYTAEGDSPTFLYSVNPALGDYDDLSFKKGQNVWYVLQVCALYLGCKIFFADGKAYCVDYRISRGSKYIEGAVDDRQPVNLYTEDTSDPIYARITGSVTLGNEGLDTVINAQTIACSDSDGKSKTYTYKPEGLGVVRAGNQLNIPELIQGGDYTQAETFARNLVDYRKEPQQSVSFKLKEMQGTNDSLAWKPFFGPSTRVDSITSTADDFTVTNISTSGAGRRLQKLVLSQYERSYPEGITKYTFGIMSNIDLAASTSQILNNQVGQ